MTDFSVEVVKVVFPESLSVEIFRGNDGVSTAYARRLVPSRWRMSKTFQILINHLLNVIRLRVGDVAVSARRPIDQSIQVRGTLGAL